MIVMDTTTYRQGRCRQHRDVEIFTHTDTRGHITVLSSAEVCERCAEEL